MHDASGGEEKLELELQIDVSHPVGAGNGSWALCKSKSVLAAKLFLLPLTFIFSTPVLNLTREYHREKGENHNNCSF